MQQKLWIVKYTNFKSLYVYCQIWWKEEENGEASSIFEICALLTPSGGLYIVNYIVNYNVRMYLEMNECFNITKAKNVTNKQMQQLKATIKI